MSVPSRSRKTAGRVSSGETVILEAGDELLVRDGGGAEFADDNGAGVVGDFRGLSGRGLAAKREGKEGNGRVARPGDIEDLSCLRRNVMGALPL